MSNVTVLVFSWDKASLAWGPFAHGFRKYWPDNPFDIVFITNFLDPPIGRPIKVGNDNCFYSKMESAFAEIETPYLLFMHEDYWLTAPVNTKAILEYVKILEQGNADYIRLAPKPGPSSDSKVDKRLGQINQKDRYRLSFMASIWRVTFLKELLASAKSYNYSIWNIEKYGTELTKKYIDNFLCVKRSSYGMSYEVMIRGGMWVKAAYKYADKENLSIDFKRLPYPSVYKRIKIFLYAAKQRLLRLLRVL